MAAAVLPEMERHMSKIQSSLSMGNGAPDRAEPSLVDASTCVDQTFTGVEMPGGEPRTDDRAGIGEYSLLSRPAAPQGRRSLFRR